MRTTLVIVLAVAATALVWVFALTLDLAAGFGAIVLAVTADMTHSRVIRPGAAPVNRCGQATSIAPPGHARQGTRRAA